MNNWRVLIRRRPQTIAVVIMFVIFFVMASTFLSNEATKNIPNMPKYLHQQTYHNYNARTTQYNISVIADKDKDSKATNGWESILKNGILTRDAAGYYSIKWTDQEIKIRSKMNEDGRGMELSDLTYYNNFLYSFDDRTGIVYEIDAEGSQAIARHILPDGNGRTNKGFKCEWSTVKDGLLHIGGLGKEWTNPEGEVVSRDPQYIKTIDTLGHVEHISWVHVYESIRTETGYQNPGYLIHEAVRFNPEDRRWYFLPRRASTKVYNDQLDERRGANLVISTNEDFDDIKTFHIGEQIPSHGFSAFVFVPHREHEVIALKTEELEGAISTYITAFDFATKTVLMEETKIGDVKFEGVEFL